METSSGQSTMFSSLGVAPRLIEILSGMKLTTPTDIQQKAIPPALDGKDVVGIAQTGTGKTLAFALPMIQRLLANQGGCGLIIVPTRELAAQVEAEFQKVGRVLGLKTALLVGGTSMFNQVSALRRAPHVIIGTPGRMNDHLQHKTLNLSRVSIVVLDEADRMLDIGFLPQIKKIFQVVPHERQTMLFSATVPDEVFTLAKQYMKLPVRIEIARTGTVADRVDQEFFMVSLDQKSRLLEKILGDNHGSVLIFSRTKHGAKRLAYNIRSWGHTAAEIHSNRSLVQRREALEGFKSGKYRILVATDIAARGIDVTGIALVINYDLPQQTEDYVHRIGRTGRMGMAGKAISFAMPNQRHAIRAIERFIRTAIVVSQLPELPPARVIPRTPTAPRTFYPKRTFPQSPRGRGNFKFRPTRPFRR